MAAEVERWLADEPVTAYREPLRQRVRRWGRRHRVLVTSLAVLLLSAGVALSVGLVLVNQAWGETQQALIREETEKQDKVAALGSATRQRQLALATIRKVVDKIHAELKDRPDLHELREALLQQAQEGLDEVAREADTAQAIDHEQIRVHFELGDLYLLMEEKGVGPAVEQYERGHTIAGRLAEADPRNAEVQSNLAVSLSKLGDVRLQLGDTKAALDAYQQAHDVLKRLAEADPRNAQAQSNLAVSLERLGDVRLQLRDTKAALDAYQQSFGVRQHLAQADPRNAEAQRDLMISHYKLGKLQEGQHVFAAAADWYAKGLEQMRRWPDPNFFRKPIADFEGWLHLCRAADQALTDVATVTTLPAPLRLDVLAAILPALVQQKHRDKLLTVGDLLAKEEKNPAALYDAVRAVALCIPLADKADDKEKHAVRAVALLKQAIAVGFKNRAHLDQDRDLDPLRPRPDFQAVLKTLEAKPPPP